MTTKKRISKITGSAVITELNKLSPVTIDCGDAEIIISLRAEAHPEEDTLPEYFLTLEPHSTIPGLSPKEATLNTAKDLHRTLGNWQRQVREWQGYKGLEANRKSEFVFELTPEMPEAAPSTDPIPEPIPTPEPVEAVPSRPEVMTEKSRFIDSTIGTIITDEIHEEINGEKTKAAIKKHIEELCDEYGIVPNKKELHINFSTGERHNAGSTHKQFEEILIAVSAKVNIALVGPAGSGKTTAVHKAADALGLPFYSKSVSSHTSPHEFFGYQDANGKYVRTLFRESYENGGVFLLDEFDAGNPNVLAALNQATANGSCAFADGMIEKHEDFIIVMAGNTFGHGATIEYVGRNKIDAATLDRFAFINFQYDEDLELELSTNKAWCKKVQALRGIIEAKKIRTIISPRATFNGERLLAAGMSEDKVLDLVIFKGLETDEVVMMKAALKA